MNANVKIPHWGLNYPKLPWLILAVGLLGTAFVSLQVLQATERAWANQFAFTCDQVTLKIQERLAAYALVLRGGAALFAATGYVNRQEWRAYVETLRVSGSVPGALGIGFNQIVPADQLAAHIAQIRREGFPDYTVFPPGKRAWYAPVVFIEPFLDRNLRAFGYDVYAEPVRRAAMEQARDTGEAALSGKIDLVQETGMDHQAGVLMFEPVYQRDAAVNTVAQRRAALTGWVSSPYRLHDLMVGILGDWESREGQTIALQIFDGLAAIPANLLFESQPKSLSSSDSLLRQQRIVSFHGRQWLLIFERKTGASVISYATAWISLVSGCFVSVLLFGLARSTIQTQANANRIARKLTEAIRLREQALQESEEKTRLLLDSTAEAIYGLDMSGDCTFCNPTCLRLLGYQHPDELLGNNMHWLIHGKTADGSFFPQEECRIFKAFQSGERMHVDDEVLWRADGTFFPAEYWSHPQIRDGVVVGAVVTFWDITERKRLEALVAHSKQLLLTVVDTAPVRIFWKDANLRYLGSNLAFAQDAGMSHPRELVGKDDHQMSWAAQADLYHADDRSIMASGIAKLSYEERQTTPDGDTRWIRTSKAPLRNQGGDVCGVVGIYENINHIKKMQDELVRREAELRATVYSVGDALLSLDVNGCILMMNPVAEQLTGWRESEAHGKSIEDVFCLVDARTRAPVYAPGLLVIQQQSPISTGTRLLLTSRDGTERIINQNVAPILDPLGKKIGIVVVFRDLTWQMEREQTLLNQSAIIQTFEGFAALADRESKLIFINQGGIRMLGSTEPDALIGKDLAEFTQLSNFLAADNDLALPVDDTPVWNGENLLRRLDGNTIPVAQTLFLIRDTDGAPKFIGVIMMDVSPMKAMQEQLLLSEKLSAMGRILADVAHELNNPLAIIIGRVELMLSQMAQPLSPLGKGLESVLQAARRCKNVLANLLAYRPIIDENKDTLNIPYLITEAIGHARFQFDMSSIDIVTNYQISHAEVVGNKHFLLSVFINIFGNAKQSIDQHGSLCVTVGVRDQAHLAIEIEDTGVGMSAAQLSELFQPFHSEWADGRGNGLGLAISRGIIEAHGGQLWVESKGVGAGTKVTILLPYQIGGDSGGEIGVNH